MNIHIDYLNMKTNREIQRYTFSNKNDLDTFLKKDFHIFFFHKMVLEEDSKEEDLVYSLWKGDYDFESFGIPFLSQEKDLLYRPVPVSYFITPKGHAHYALTDFFINANLKRDIQSQAQKMLSLNQKAFAELRLKNNNIFNHLIEEHKH